MVVNAKPLNCCSLSSYCSSDNVIACLSSLPLRGVEDVLWWRVTTWLYGYGVGEQCSPSAITTLSKILPRIMGRLNPPQPPLPLLLHSYTYAPHLLQPTLVFDCSLNGEVLLPAPYSLLPTSVFSFAANVLLSSLQFENQKKAASARQDMHEQCVRARTGLERTYFSTHKVDKTRMYYGTIMQSK